MVICDVTGGITLGTKLKSLIGIRFQIKLNNISMTKDWSDQEVNTQIDQISITQFSTHKLQDQIFTER